jgi:outer membrane protein TolC
MRIQVLVAGCLSVAALAPCDDFSPRFPTPAYFRHHFTTPKARVELQPPVRFQDFIADGRLELSLRDYLELVLANNTEIAISRLNLEIPKNNILRQYGTFDPALVGSFNTTRQKRLPSDALAGASILNNLDQIGNFSYQQTLETGTQFSVGFIGSKASTNSAFQTWNPNLNAALSFRFTQPLLRGRGTEITRLPITIARGQLRQQEYTLRDMLLRLLTTAENAYWDVVDARENLRVQEENLKLNEAFLKRSQRELELGALSPLEIYQPQQQYASAEVQVSRFRYTLARAEDVLRRQIGADLDPDVRKLPIALTETVMPPLDDDSTIDKEALVEKAMATRPDLKSVLQQLDIDDLNIKSAGNSLRPDLALTGGYTSTGRGGIFYERQNVFGGGSQIVRTVPGGFGDALDQVFGFGIPTYQFGLQLRLPLRDRRASADMANAVVQKRLDTLRARNTEQLVRQEVLNAINLLESARAGVRLAQVAVDFARKRVDAEQRRYDLGVTVPYFVLAAQTDLVNAQSELVTNTINYRRAQVNLLRFTGELLEERGVVVQ